jgi:hypothetical protein
MIVVVPLAFLRASLSGLLVRLLLICALLLV